MDLCACHRLAETNTMFEHFRPKADDHSCLSGDLSISCWTPALTEVAKLKEVFQA